MAAGKGGRARASPGASASTLRCTGRPGRGGGGERELGAHVGHEGPPCPGRRRVCVRPPGACFFIYLSLSLVC